MTLSEFKAWFDGFTEDMPGAPTKKQWERIKSRVGEITGHAVTYPVYIDRYVAPVRPYWDRVWAYGSTNTALDRQPNAVSLNGSSYLNAGDFDSHKAMTAIGRADALALAQ